MKYAIFPIHMNETERKQERDRQKKEALSFYHAIETRDPSAAKGAEVVLVDPKNTTQRCSKCGHLPEKRIDLKRRIYECKCGLVLNRDHNSALEILRLGLEQAHMERQPLLDEGTSKRFRGNMKPTPFMGE